MDQLIAAVAAVESGELSLRAASEKYGIPYTTLWKRMNVRLIPNSSGRPTMFSAFDEEVLAEMLRGFETMNMCVNPGDFLRQVQEFGAKIGVQGDIDSHWVRRFLKRHNLNVFTKQAKDHGNEVKFTAERAEEYIARLDKLMTHGYLDNPARIINLDETGYKLAYRKGKGIGSVGRKGAAPVYERGDERKQISVLMSAVADGTHLTPMILYDGKVFLAEWADGIGKNAVITKNQSGVMDTVTFCAYVEQIVIPYLQELDPSDPGNTKGLLIFDGHYSHIYNLPLVELCRKHGIALLCLPAGQTSKLQPLDVKVFGPLKSQWKKHLTTQGTKKDKITRNNFPRHFVKVLLEVRLKYSILSGFETAGICPYDPDKIRAAVWKPPVPQQLPSHSPEARGLISKLTEFLLREGTTAGYDESSIQRFIAGFEHTMNVREETQSVVRERVLQILGPLEPERPRTQRHQLNTGAGELLHESPIKRRIEERLDSRKVSRRNLLQEFEEAVDSGNEENLELASTRKRKRQSKTTDDAAAPPRKRGRPLGSKNRKK